MTIIDRCAEIEEESRRKAHEQYRKMVERHRQVERMFAREELLYLALLLVSMIAIAVAVLWP